MQVLSNVFSRGIREASETYKRVSKEWETTWIGTVSKMYLLFWRHLGVVLVKLCLIETILVVITFFFIWLLGKIYVDERDKKVIYYVIWFLIALFIVIDLIYIIFSSYVLATLLQVYCYSEVCCSVSW